MAKRKESWSEWLARQARRVTSNPAVQTSMPGMKVLDEVIRNPGVLKQIPAGAIESTVANSSQTPGNYRPAVVDAVPALVGTIATLARGKRMDRSNVVERAIEGSVDRALIATQRTNEALGIENPSNTTETGLRILGGLAIPVKGASIGRAAQSVAPRATGAIARTAARVPAPVRTTAKVAAEIATPFRNTGVVPAAVAGGVMTGVADQIAEKVDPAYESSINTFADNRPQDFFEDIEQGAEEDFFAAVENEPSIAEIDEIEAEEQAFNWENAGLALGAVLGGAAIAKYAPKILATRVDEAIESVPTFTGKKYRRSRGGIVERAQTAAVQQDQPLRNAADDFLSPQQAAEYKHNADLINNVSIGSRVAHFFRTGRTHGLDTPTVKLAPYVEAYAKELSLDEQRAVSDALLAQSALDDIERTGSHAALNLSRDGSPVTPAQLRAIVSSARANPKYAKYMDTVVRSYQDLLKFRVARGTLSPEKARELASLRPNYVRMSRDLTTEAKQGTPEPFNANKHRMAGGFSRAEDELQGVQGVTGVGNPFNNLLDDWANEIRRAEVNDLRSFWLENMSQANPQLVRRIPNGTTPNTMEGVHTVRRNGVDVSYKVNDEIASSALEFAPRASIQSLELMRQVAQNLVTGPLGTLTNGFAFFKSPLYDTTMGMLLKPENVQLGLVNELLSKYGKGIGRLDPTALLSAFTGAARYAWDDLRRAMAQNLSDQLIREHTWLRDALGDTNVTALRDRLESAYQASVKSLMDEQGITSLTMHGSPDPSEVMTGLQSVTPRFSSAMAEQLAKDTMDARANGEVGPLKSLLLRDASGFAQARASTIARTYGALLEAMHNGFRYSMVAANRSRNSDLKQLASQARRISVDSAQHGGNDTINKTLSAFMYSNLTVQSLHAVAQRIKNNPAQFLGNLASITLPLVAMHYLAVASDPKAKEQHAGKSASQKSTSVTTFGGAEIPIDPVLRLMIMPLLTTLDHMTGAHDGNWNRPFLEAMSTWLSSDDPDDDYSQDIEDVMWQAVKANNPFTPEAFPGTSGILAAAGIDPGMTRVSGEAAPIHLQKVSGFNQDQKRTDSMTSGFIENLITSLGGSFAQNLMVMSNDAYRAYSRTGDVAASAEMALSRYRDTLARGSTVARPILFGDYEQTKAVTDTNWQIVREKDKGIEQAANLYNRNARATGQRTGVDPGTAVKYTEDAQSDSIRGTQNAVIGAAAVRLQSRLGKIDEKLAQLTKLGEGVRNGYLTEAQEKNRQLNELVEQRRYYMLLRRQIIEAHEEAIRERIGDEDFEFEAYNPDDYTTPWVDPSIEPTIQ